MKIESADGGGLIDTDMLKDIDAQMIEMIGGSKINEFAIKHNGVCFLTVGIPSAKSGWSLMHIPDFKSLEFVVMQLNDVVKKMSNNKYIICFAENKEI